MNVERVRHRGQRAVDRVTDAYPARRSAWAQLSDEDRESLAVWIGSPWFPPIRRLRRADATQALENGVDATRVLLQERRTTQQVPLPDQP